MLACEQPGIGQSVLIARAEDQAAQLFEGLSRVAGQSGQVGEKDLGMTLGDWVRVIGGDFAHGLIDVFDSFLREEDVGAEEFSFQPPFAASWDFFQQSEFGAEPAHGLEGFHGFA